MRLLRFSTVDSDDKVVYETLKESILVCSYTRQYRWRHGPPDAYLGDGCGEAPPRVPTLPTEVNDPRFGPIKIFRSILDGTMVMLKQKTFKNIPEFK